MAGVGVHQPVQLRVLGDSAVKGDDGPGHTEQAMARLHIGHISHLGVGDMQEITQLLPVGGRLVEEHQELGVCEHEAGGIRAEAFLHILGCGGQNAAVFAKPLPCPV